MVKHRDLAQVLGVDLVGKALDHREQDFFYGSLPPFAQLVLHAADGHRPFHGVATLVVDLSILELPSHGPDKAADGLRMGRRLAAAEADSSGTPIDRPHRHRLPAASALLMEEEEEGDIVRKDDDLPSGGLVRKPCRNPLPVHMVERGDRIVEDDRRVRVRRSELGEEGGKSNAAVLALAENLPHSGPRLVDKADAKERDALSRTLLLQLDRQARDAEPIDLPGEFGAQARVTKRSAISVLFEVMRLVVNTARPLSARRRTCAALSRRSRRPSRRRAIHGR